jgi:hypothetical protein
MKRIPSLSASCLVAFLGVQSLGLGAQGPIPSALLPFAERGSSVKGVGEKVGDLLFAELAKADAVWLVDRQDIDKTLSEQELSASGMVNPDQAVKIGSLTGAKVLISGSVFEVDKKLHIVAKIVGTETSRTLGAAVEGDGNAALAPLVKTLAAQVNETVKSKSKELLAPEAKPEDGIAALKKTLAGATLPSATIAIAERHVGQATLDPAAETEFSLYYIEAGGAVLSKEEQAKADIRIEGEGFSETATRRGDLVSVKARVEVKAVEVRTGAVLATDRETAIEVDLTEQIAGKAALQRASARIAARMLPKLAKKK